MTKLMIMCAGLCAAALGVAAANTAQAAGNNFSYVSNTGLDSHGCTNPTTDACATFSGALAKTANYGEIDCAKGYAYGGGLNIQQSVTIDCAGGVATSGGLGDVTITSLAVRLRNLSFNSNGNGGVVIIVEDSGAVYFENCVITNYNNSQSNIGGGANTGIVIDSEGGPGTAQLFISNSVVSNNGDSAVSLSGGVYIKPRSGVATNVSIDHSQITGNYFGIVADGRSGGIINVAISDSVVSGSTENGITALSAGSRVLFMLDQTEVTQNTAAGLFATGSGAGILARNTTVFNNGTGLDAASGAGIISYGNNSVAGNATNGAFTTTVSQE
jgi:hypothetical protein